MRQITKRLIDGADLREGITAIAKENNIKAGVIISAVGSLKKANLRMAGGETSRSWDGPLEIVSATGTLSQDGMHIHISVSDKDGSVFGGHLSEGCFVRTTVEIVVLTFDDAEYKRELDDTTGYKELKV